MNAARTSVVSHTEFNVVSVCRNRDFTRFSSDFEACGRLARRWFPAGAAEAILGRVWRGSSGAAMLEVIGVSHRAGRETVLDKASLKLVPGRALVVLAPAGRARLALLRLAAGLEKPQSGAVRFAGEDASRSRALRGGTFW